RQRDAHLLLVGLGLGLDGLGDDRLRELHALEDHGRLGIAQRLACGDLLEAHAGGDVARPDFLDRSEEHTSELQSRENLVCRLPPAHAVTHTLSLHDALPICDSAMPIFSWSALVLGSTAWEMTGSGNSMRSRITGASGSHSVSPVVISLRPTQAAMSPARTSLIDRKSTRLNSSHVKISYAVFRRRTPSPTPFPYTTLFRSATARCPSSPGRPWSWARRPGR